MFNCSKSNNFCRLFVVVLFCCIFGSIDNTDVFAGKTDFDADSKLSISGDAQGELVYDDLESKVDFAAMLRLRLQAAIADNFHVWGRLNTEKVYGGKTYDNANTFVDQLFFKWEKIMNTPFEFSGGRLPTMGETSPSHLRLGFDQPRGILSSNIDIPLDGMALGYNFQRPFPGKVTLFCASQFDIAYEGDREFYLKDSDIYGVKIDSDFGKRGFWAMQSFLVSNVWNLPDSITIFNPLAYGVWEADSTLFNPKNASQEMTLDRKNLGDIYQTSMTYINNLPSFDFFINLAWSHTNAKAIDEMGTGLLSSWWDEPENRDGYFVYAGVRYDLKSIRSKIGVEYNFGSKYWINFSENNEAGKLATRGSVYEVYFLYFLPLPAAWLNGMESIVWRVGYQYYDYAYTLSGSPIVEPIGIDDIKNDPFAVKQYGAIDAVNRVYSAIAIYF